MPEEDRQIRIPERPFDRSSTKFQSKEPGKIIKSSRKFGVEIEMFHPKRKAIVDLSEAISSAFGFEHDGSIDAGSHAGIEVVTPIMRGHLGETGVNDLFSRANKLGFKVNKTCGLHIHLDGENFTKNDQVTVVQADSINTKLIRSMNPDDYGFFLRADVVKALTRNNAMRIEEIARLLMDEYFTSNSNQLFLSKTLGTNVPEIRVRDCSYKVDKLKFMADIYQLAYPTITYPELNGQVISRIIPEPTDYFVIIHSNKNLQNLITLLYLHVVFGDVFMSMLPKSRRQDNLYCQQLSLGFSAGQLENIASWTELENAWYRTKSTFDVQRRKGNKYDDSRYFSMNLHSLFAKYGTIEIRSHSATLDPNKVLYWVAFHQEILDNIANGVITISSLSKGSHLFHVEDKTEFLLKSLGLRAPLRTYMKQRIEYFANNEKK